MNGRYFLIIKIYLFGLLVLIKPILGFLLLFKYTYKLLVYLKLDTQFLKLYSVLILARLILGIFFIVGICIVFKLTSYLSVIWVSLLFKNQFLYHWFLIHLTINYKILQINTRKGLISIRSPIENYRY